MLVWQHNTEINNNFVLGTLFLVFTATVKESVQQVDIG